MSDLSLQTQVTALQQTMRRHTHDGNETQKISAQTTTAAGTVVSVGVTTANGISGSVVNSTTTPLITLSLGAITPTSVTASGNGQFASIGLNTTPVAGAVMVGAGQYFSIEYNNGNVTGTATINWNNGNVQYITMIGNVTLTFTNPQSGGRYLLHAAGANTPTFPGTIRWPSGITPAATATSNHKDIYTFIYSGKESLYDGIQSANFAIT